MTIQEQIKALEKKKRELIRKDKEKRAKELLKYADLIDIDVLQKIKDKIGTKIKVRDYGEKDEYGNIKEYEYTITKEAAKRHINRAIRSSFDAKDFKQ